MTTQTFETSKGTLYVVDLPEGATPSIFDFKNERYVSYDGTIWGADKLPPGDWQPLGLLKDISEEQADEVVEWVDSGEYYFDYSRPTEAGWNGDITALESLTSLLETKISLKNPKGEKPNQKDYVLTGKTEQETRMIEEDRKGLRPSWKRVFELNYQDRLKEYQTAEAEVWKHFYLIFKTK